VNATVPELIDDFPRYLQHFAKCPPTQLRMEATPQYLTKNMTAPNIKEIYTSFGQDLHELRFLIIVRNPVKRVLSHYRHMVRLAHWPEDTMLGNFLNVSMDKYHNWLQSSTPGELYTDRMTDMVMRGLYEHSIGFWFTQFDPSQFMILSLKQLMTDTAGVMDAVHDFIGVSRRHAEMHATNLHHHGTSDRTDPPEGLEEFYEPHVKALFELKEKYPGSFYDTQDNPFSLEM